jgi:hypothetical protein
MDPRPASTVVATELAATLTERPARPVRCRKHHTHLTPHTSTNFNVSKILDLSNPGSGTVRQREAVVGRMSQRRSLLLSGVAGQAASHAAASGPVVWQSRQRASYASSAPTTIVSPE